MSDAIKEVGVKISPEQSWKSDVARLIRRSEISRQLGSKLPGDEIRGAVREHEKSLNVSQLTEGLVSEVFVVSLTTEKIATELFEELKTEFDFLDAIVLLGSSAHGGAFVREAVKADADEHDLDWGIVVKGSVEATKIIALYDKAVGLLPKIGKNYGKEDDYQSCWLYNPKMYFVKKLTSLDQAMELLSRSKNSDDFVSNRIPLYFSPSIPENVNIDNRNLILESLKVMYKKDKAGWKFLISEISSHHNNNHHLKTKHFISENSRTNRDIKIRDRVVSQSRDVMTKTMHELLKSTAKR